MSPCWTHKFELAVGFGEAARQATGNARAQRGARTRLDFAPSRDDTRTASSDRGGDAQGTNQAPDALNGEGSTTETAPN